MIAINFRNLPISTQPDSVFEDMIDAPKLPGLYEWDVCKSTSSTRFVEFMANKTTTV